MDEMVTVACMCCGRPMTVQKGVLLRMRIPTYFCETCDNLYDPMFKRLCVQMTMIGHTVSHHHEVLYPAT
jgi:hypothetical protein